MRSSHLLCACVRDDPPRSRCLSLCLQVGRRPRQPLAHPLSSVAARLRLERRRRRHPPTRQPRLSGRRLLLRPLGRRRLHLRPSRRRRRLHLRPSERRRLLLRPLGWRRLQLHLSGQRRLLLLSVRQVWAAQLARGAKKNLSHRVCGRGRFDGTGLRCSIRTRWRPSIWFYFRTWRRACVWGCTVSIGVWHTLPTRRNISFRYVRVSAHIIPRPGPTTVRVLLFTGGKGVFGAAQGGGAFAAPSGGGGGFASYAPQAASGGFGALAQAGGSAPAPSFGGHR